MHGASTADSREPAGNGLSGAMKPHAGVVGGHAVRPGEGLHRLAAEVHLLDSGAVLGLQATNDFLYAGTGLGLELRFKAFAPARGPLVQGPGMGIETPVVIGDRVSEDAVEPGDGAFAVADLGSVFDGFEVRGLEDVLRGGRIGDSGRRNCRNLLCIWARPAVIRRDVFAGIAASPAGESMRLEGRKNRPLPGRIPAGWCYATGQVQRVQVQTGLQAQIPFPQLQAPGAHEHPWGAVFFSVFDAMVFSPSARPEPRFYLC